MTPAPLALSALPIVLAALLCPAPGGAQETGPPIPSRADAEGPPWVASPLQKALEAGREELGARGVSAAVVFPDGRIWTGTSGEAFQGAPVTPETVFEIGSVTKTFTAALAVQLARKGVLSLDAPLARWVPDFPGAAEITLRQLLSHTSGIADAMQTPGFIPTLISDPSRRWTPVETFSFLGEPHFAPGEGWRYSSTGFHLVGLAIEAAMDRPLHGLLRERFFEPLELPRTFLGSHEEVPGPRAHAFLDVDQDGRADDLSAMIPPTSFLTAAWSAGAVISSAEDLARWMRALHGGKVLDEAGYAEMERLIDRPDGRRYGLGLLVDEVEGLVLYGHEGNSAGFSAAAWHAPESGVSVAVLANVHGKKVRPVTQRLLAHLAGS